MQYIISFIVVFFLLAGINYLFRSDSSGKFWAAPLAIAFAFSAAAFITNNFGLTGWISAGLILLIYIIYRFVHTQTPLTYHSDTQQEMVTIQRYHSHALAQIDLQKLKLHGIPAQIHADDAGGAFPELLALTGGARLLVRKESEPAARKLLEHA